MATYLGAHPAREGALDADARAHIEEERQAYNRRCLLVVAPILFGIHVLVAISFSRIKGTTPAHALWIYWLVRLHAGMAGVAVLLFLAATLRDGFLVSFLRPRLGDVATALYVLFGAVVNANAQRAHPALNMFVLANFAAAIVYRARPSVYAASLTVGSGVLITGVLVLQPDASIAIVNTITC
jgi:hypothetical protein